MKKVKICYFIGSLKFGGAQKHLVDLINNLDKNIFDVFLILGNDKGYFFDKLNIEKDHILHLNLRRYYDLSGLIGILKVVKYLWLNQIDIFHSYLFECNVYGAICRLFKPKMRYLISIRNMNYTYSSRKIVSLKIASWVSNYVTVVCKKVGEFVVEREKINPSKIKVLYNSVDHLAYSCSKVKKNGFQSDGAINIACVASLNYRKGHDYLLKALNLILKENKYVMLHLFGDGKQRNELEVIAREIGVDKNVIFHGYVKDMADYLSGMDIFVLSSLEEGMSNALLEAMSAGLPSVTTDVGGNAEVNIDGKTGFVVPSKDDTKLADSILKLVRDEALRMEMANNAHKRVFSFFSIDSMMKKYVKFYYAL